jgi:hypothetical protein
MGLTGRELSVFSVIAVGKSVGDKASLQNESALTRRNVRREGIEPPTR